MRKGILLAAYCFWTICGAATMLCQNVQTQSALHPNAKLPACTCGTHPPGPEQTWTLEPYANEPEDMRPFAKFAKPYQLNYLQPTIWNGPGRETADPKGLKEVRIGFVGSLSPEDPDLALGMRMLHGAQMAIDEANSRGGYNGIPYRLMLHGDYNNWQANATAGSRRPTDPEIWGSAADVAVKVIYDDKAWAIFGSINSESTHIMLRVALKAEIPIVNSASTDPTIPETSIPWYFTDLQDDRVQSDTLARHMYSELGLRHVAILRVSNRYGRMGVAKFRDASRRMGHPVVIEQDFLSGETDFRHALENIRDSGADSIVLWTDQVQAAMILKQMHALGMQQRAFGSYRTLGPELLAAAGPAAEGFEAVYPYDPTRRDPKWIAFNQRFQARFHEPPDPFASLAYDAMQILLDSICRAGLNRVRIQDALDDIRQYDGVTGQMNFDPNHKNLASLYLAKVHNGSITYQLASMNKSQNHGSKLSVLPVAAAAPVPYARVGSDGVGLAPGNRHMPGSQTMQVVVFGPNAAREIQSVHVQDAIHQRMAGSGQWKLLPIESRQNWGTATMQLVDALGEQHPVAIVALDRDAAHLAEQMSLKCFLPVVALSDDRSLTAANIPWIFRLPADTELGVAVQLIRKAAVRGGSDPRQIRDALASGDSIAGNAFLATGERRIP